jgi:hypothetical protein
MFKLNRIFVLILSVLMSLNAYSITENCVSCSDNYQELIDLFTEFKQFNIPSLKDGIVDYSEIKVKAKYDELKVFQKRLESIDTADWSVTEQVDFYLLKTEMNGMDFQYRVLHPWKSNPNFYLQNMPLAEYADDYPTSEEGKKEIVKSLKLISLHFDQARENMQDISNVSGDLAKIAIRTLEKYNPFDHLVKKLVAHNPELDRDKAKAKESMDNYLFWMKQNLDLMTRPAGIGKENYNWLLKNVFLMPYNWEDCLRIVELEDNRVISFRELEKNRNRNLSELVPVNSQQGYRDSYINSISTVMNFLKEENIMTVQDYLTPDGYIKNRGQGMDKYSLTMPWPEHHDYFFNFSLRESLMEETHEMVGHHFDVLRSQEDNRIIRGTWEHEGPYNAAVFRNEGFAFALEELLMHAGYLDSRPRRAREIAYEQAAFRTVRAMSDIKMHANEWNLDEATNYCVETAPNGHLLKESFHLWYELETTLSQVGWHMAMVVGKVYFMKTVRDVKKQMGDDFVLKNFMDNYLAAGMIPPSLIRWEMTGLDDEIKELNKIINYE